MSDESGTAKVFVDLLPVMAGLTIILAIVAPVFMLMSGRVDAAAVGVAAGIFIGGTTMACLLSALAAIEDHLRTLRHYMRTADRRADEAAYKAKQAS